MRKKIQLQNKGKDTGYFEIRNITETTADLIIYGEITSSEWWGDEVTPTQMKDLLDSAGGKDLKIYINSPGGDVFAGVAIYNMIKRYSGKKDVYIDGLAASAASIIAMAGDTINIPKNAYLMIHNAWTWICGNAKDLLKEAENLERIDKSIVETYVTKANNDTTAETFETLMNNETWLNGSEAEQYFHVNVIDIQPVSACVSKEAFENYKHIPEKLKNSPLKTENEEIEKQKMELEKAKLKLKLTL